MRKRNIVATLLGLGLILLSLIEFLVETRHGIEKYGYLGGALFGIYYLHKIFNQHQYRERDKIWFAMFYAIGEAVGAKWNADTLRVIERHLAERSKIGFTSSWVGKSPAPSARPFTILNMRRKKFMERLKSRKLWVAVISGVLVILNNELQWGFSEATIYSFVGLAATYILGQSHVDAKKAANGGVYNVPAESNPPVQSAK